MTIKKAVSWVIFWLSIAMIFNAGIFFTMGKQKALEFFGGYIIELSLSLDNLFLFLMIFSFYGIKPLYQRRVLNYGIAGAIILRLIFVILGIAIINKFHWILYLFGLILIVSGIKMFFNNDECRDFQGSLIIKGLKRIIPIAPELYEEKFFVRLNNVLHATPLLAILVLIEGSDILFAIDSIPAIFSVTTDPFMVYSSNIFAILGLRNMYFVLEKLHQAFRYVKYGVAVILTFTGIKLSLLLFHIEIPLTVSISIIFAIVLFSILLSIVIPEKEKECNEK